MLYLVDSSIYLFRAWHDNPKDMTDRLGQPFNAVDGLAEYFVRLMNLPDADAILCAWDDCGRTGARNRILPDYKQHRPPAALELQSQFARCRLLAPALGLCGIGSTLVEADDIIGHFSHLARQERQSLTLISGDKDLVQFIGPDDLYWDFGRHNPQSYRTLHKRFKVRPEQFADWLALCGDKGDNIPGVPQVGPGTASRLLKRWQDLDAVFDNLESISGMRFRGAAGVARNLFEYKGQVRLARRLTGLIRDPALPDSLSGLKRQPRQEAAIKDALHQIGFSDDRADELARRAAGSMPFAERAPNHNDQSVTPEPVDSH